MATQLQVLQALPRTLLAARCLCDSLQAPGEPALRALTTENLVRLLGDRDDPDCEAALVRLASSDPDPDVREVAVRGLSSPARAKRRRYELERILRTDPSPRARRAALASLASLGAEAVPGLLLHISAAQEDPPLRRAGILALARMGSAPAQAALEQLARADPSPELRALAGQRAAALPPH